MNKKLIIMLAAVATAGVMFAHPGFHGGPRGFHGGPPMRGPGFHHHHHHHHCGWGVAGAVLGTAALVHDIVRPAPVVVAPPPPVYAPAPVVVNPAPVVVQPGAVVSTQSPQLWPSAPIKTPDADSSSTPLSSA